MQKEVKQIEISKIFIMNPRARNAESAKEIRENICAVGLKRPIKLMQKLKPSKDGKEYDLICGQGRLEAYKALGWDVIPAYIEEITQEDALIQSLVENLVRRVRKPSEMYREVKNLYDSKYSASEIAEKIGVSYEWITQILKLITRGEERLLNAVESDRLPLNIAVQIIETDSSEVQQAMQDAYDKGLLRGHSLKEVLKLLELRMANGKQMRDKGIKKKSPKDVGKIIEQEMERKRALVIKARRVEERLLSFRESFKTLTADENFLNMLAAEKLGDVPYILMEGEAE
jgi:ParB family chromosome partitioning protein